MSNRWDVIVVGARCAGATLAALLARSGVRTLLLEASPRGTDLPLSTHFIQAPGVDVLDRLGLGERARAAAPLSRRIRLALDEVEIVGEFEEGRGGLCLRRSTVDPWLQDLAESSGAEFRDRHRVVDLVWDADRVAGVVVEGANGREELRVSLVVGADGPHSTVAKLTKAREYLVAHSNRAGYYDYYPAPATWSHGWDATLEHRGDDIRYLFRADGDVVLMVYLGPQAALKPWGKDWRERLHTKLLESETTRPFVEGKEPARKGCGLLDAKYFYREAAGKGFALVGDAGHFKDYVTGQGMTDAFLDAERLARAVVDGREIALEHFWRERDVATMPLHFDALQQGLVGFNSPFMRYVFSRFGERPNLAARIPRVIDRRLAPQDMIPMSAMLPWMAGALLRGRFDVLQGFMATGKTQSAEQQELAMRRKLLADVERRMGTDAPARAA